MTWNLDFKVFFLFMVPSLAISAADPNCGLIERDKICTVFMGFQKTCRAENFTNDDRLQTPSQTLNKVSARTLAMFRQDIDAGNNFLTITLREDPVEDHYAKALYVKVQDTCFLYRMISHYTMVMDPLISKLSQYQTPKAKALLLAIYLDMGSKKAYIGDSGMLITSDTYTFSELINALTD